MLYNGPTSDALNPKFPALVDSEPAAAPDQQEPPEPTTAAAPESRERYPEAGLRTPEATARAAQPLSSAFRAVVCAKE